MNPATFQTISAHLDAGQPEQARLQLLRVLKTSPRDADANNLMAVALARTGKPEAAVLFAERAIEIAPHATNVRANLANILLTVDRPAEAVDQFRRVLREAPGPAPAAGLAAGLSHLRRFAEAAETALTEWARFPGYPPLAMEASGALLNSGRAVEAVKVLEEALRLTPGDPILTRRRAAAMLYAPEYSPVQVAEAHFEVGRLIAAAVAHVPRLPFRNARERGRPLKLGILSSDLRTHPVAQFSLPLFEHVDRSRFEITAYHDAGVSDSTTKQIRSFADRWLDSSTLDDEALAARIRSDQIDVLLELSGYSSRPRLATLALQPAPVVVSWLGYPSTLGIPGMGARIVDSLTDPHGPSKALHTETLVRIDPCFLCYTPRNAAAAKDLRDHIVFGSFNTLQKVNDPMLRLWARVLAAVPSARLLIKSGGLEEPKLRQQVLERAATCGIEASRLEIVGHLSTAAEHLAAYSRVDVALDTYPYCGTTTTCEALSMGVPVVSLVGGAHVSRVGLSLLSAVGHPEWCAQSEDQYVEIAANLALDPARLAQLRSSLPAQLAASPLCDHSAFVDRFAGAIQRLWDGWAAGPANP